MNKEPIFLTGTQRKLIGVLCLLFVFGNINMTMFNLAIPSISASFALTTSEVSWVMVGYSILMTIGAGTYGKLTESFSVRRLYVFGLILFTMGSIIGYLSNSYVQVIIGRVLQAAGASSIPPLSYGIATRSFPPAIRGRVLGALSATIPFASGFGPVFGGFLEQYFNWHALFLVSGLSMFVIPLVLKYVPNMEHERGSFDILGAILFSAGLATVLLGITMNWLYLPVGAVILVAFGLHIKKTTIPFIHVALLKNGSYRRYLWIGFLTFACNTGLTFLLPLMMKVVFHLSTSKIGFLILPSAASAAFLGSRIGRWSDQYGSTRVLKISQWFVIGGFILLGIAVRLTPWVDALIIIILMIGFNGVLTSSGNLVSATLHSSELAEGMGIFTMFYLLGGAFGPALIGRLVDLNIPFSFIYFIVALLGVLCYLIVKRSSRLVSI